MHHSELFYLGTILRQTKTVFVKRKARKLGSFINIVSAANIKKYSYMMVIFSDCYHISHWTPYAGHRPSTQLSKLAVLCCPHPSTSWILVVAGNLLRLQLIPLSKLYLSSTSFLTSSVDMIRTFTKTVLNIKSIVLIYFRLAQSKIKKKIKIKHHKFQYILRYQKTLLSSWSAPRLLVEVHSLKGTTIEICSLPLLAGVGMRRNLGGIKEVLRSGQQKHKYLTTSCSRDFIHVSPNPVGKL